MPPADFKDYRKLFKAREAAIVNAVAEVVELERRVKTLEEMLDRRDQEIKVLKKERAA